MQHGPSALGSRLGFVPSGFAQGVAAGTESHIHSNNSHLFFPVLFRHSPPYVTIASTSDLQTSNPHRSSFCCFFFLLVPISAFLRSITTRNPQKRPLRRNPNKTAAQSSVRGYCTSIECCGLSCLGSLNCLAA
ncbi:hypothetical protein K440DRAFT_354722 [Wilcoxina mikolae CBS 423.85]|nr:hypothetical protein K440DRAFT_354722 [Wilcoxina mikolae CBS 423.85]